MLKKKPRKIMNENVKNPTRSDDKKISFEEEIKNFSEEDKAKITASLGIFNSTQSSHATALTNAYDKCEIRNSPIEGFGIFAKEDISNGTILEEVPFILWPRYTELGSKLWNLLSQDASVKTFLGEEEKFHDHVRHVFGFKDPEKYYFKWYPPRTPKYQDKYVAYSVIPLGFGPIYNTSNSRNNAGWVVKEKTFIFKAEKDIKKGEEICTFYGYFLAENGVTFSCEDGFNFGLDWGLDENGDTCVFLRTLRFPNQETMSQRQQEPGYNQISQLLEKSKNSLKFRKISVIDDGEEKFPFDFTKGMNLFQHYAKLKEFKHSRFKNIKFSFSFSSEKEGLADVVITNHNK